MYGRRAFSASKLECQACVGFGSPKPTSDFRGHRGVRVTYTPTGPYLFAQDLRVLGQGVTLRDTLDNNATLLRSSTCVAMVLL
jgi:hypothetical protein